MSKTALSLTPENEGRAASHGIFNNSQKFVKLFWVFYSKEVSWYWKMKKNEKNLLCLLYSQTCGKQFLSSILCELLSSRAGIGGNSWMGGVVSSRRRFATLNGVAFSRRRLDTLDRVTLSRRLLDTLDSVTSPSRLWAASDSSSIVVESSPGLGTPFFSVQNVSFFSVQKRERYVFSVLFSSFWRLMKP